MWLSLTTTSSHMILNRQVLFTELLGACKSVNNLLLTHGAAQISSQTCFSHYVSLPSSKSVNSSHCVTSTVLVRGGAETARVVFSSGAN